ncbi:serine/threonine-protein kinase [Streptomyces misionensis]|uniref:serine/threonine-protein kinase n=1 Tax=Streptomyces misionensis TaxID=67331 RepID=UPI0037F51B2C
MLASQAEPGQLIGGRYRLISELAAGGFGRVWKAVDESLRVEVALKEVQLPPTSSSAEHSKRLAYAVREARNAARLRDHPHIVAVHDVVVDGGVPWTVMRLVDGHSLAQRLTADGSLPVQEVIKIATALLKALQTAHAAGIVHRDVKPANVMLAASGDVLLTDFGISVHQADTALTTSGSVIGSAEYMAPERLNGIDEPAGDLFSLGVTLYQAVEGISPFKRDTPAATLAAVALHEAPRPKRAGALTEMLTALLAKEPHERPSIESALEMVRDAAAHPRAKKKTQTEKQRTIPVRQEHRRSPVFEHSWTSDDAPVLRDTVRTRAALSAGMTAVVLLLSLLTDDELRNGSVEEWVLAVGGFYTAMYALWSWVAWHDRRDLKGQARTLRVDVDGVSFSDESGTQRIPWKAIGGVAIRYAEMIHNHHPLALHLDLKRAELENRATIFRPAGWPPDAELPTACSDTSSDGWVPVFLLGRLDTPHQVDFKNTIAAYAASRLQVETEDAGW